MKLRWRKVVLAVFALSTLAGCLTPADKWLTENLLPKEKADLMADKISDMFNQMVDADSLTDIAKIRALLQTAQKTDPSNASVAEVQKKLDTFLVKRQTEAQTKVKTLTAKAAQTLTDKEKYDLVVVVQQLQILAPPNFDLTKINSQTVPIRADVIKKSTQIITDYEKALAGNKADSAVGKIVSSIHDSIVALQVIDPKNADAAAANARLNKFLADRNKADIAAAQAAYKAKDYGTASKALIRVQQALAGIDNDTTVQVDALQYSLYFDWAKDLFTNKKYGEAGSRISDAIAIKSSIEALDLKDKITKAASARDYDAEYDVIDKQLDALVKSGDLKTAWNLVNTTGPQLKKDDTKARLSARRKQILDAAHDLYDTAVASYNDEDYREAKLAFDAVVAVDPGYQSAKAYQDKAKAKLQALGGN